MTRRGLLSFGVTLLLLLGASNGLAQEKALQEAKDRFDEGQSLFLAGRYSEAAVAFEKAFAARPFPAFLFNIAVCHERNQDYARALSYYQRFLDHDPGSPDRDMIRQRMASLRQQLSPAASQPASQPVAGPAAKLPPVRTKGLVIIESKPEGAAIYLGDKRRGVFTRTNFHGELPQGQHTIILELRKYKPERKTIQVRSDVATYLYFALSAEHYLGWMEVEANVPGAEVYFDKREVGAVGRTPFTGFVRPGRRTLYVERPGYQPIKREIEVAAGKDHRIRIDLEKVAHGWLRITGASTRGARVLVDGKPIACSAYPCRTELAPGEYAVKVERKGHKRYRERIRIEQATETQLAVRLLPSPPRTKAWVSFGVSTALLVGGIVCGVLSDGKASELEESGRSPVRPYDSEDPRLSSGKVLSITANALFGMAVVTGGLGLYYLLRREGPDSYGEARQHRIAVTPSLGPGQAGLVGTVRF